MTKSSADDVELRRACQAEVASDKHKVVMCIRCYKSPGSRGKPSARQAMAKPRILAICIKEKAQRTKAFLRVMKEKESGGGVEAAKTYKLKHLSKMEVLSSDTTGLTFTLVFVDRKSTGLPPHWTVRNIDDRNRILVQILNISKDVLNRLPKVKGIDVVEMALWAKDNTPAVTAHVAQADPQDGVPVESPVIETELKVDVEKELVSQEEEEVDMEALLGTYVMGIGEAEVFSERLKRELQALEAANVHAILEIEPLVDEVLLGLDATAHCVDDMDEWLSIFNIKLRHMREDLESIETRNNKLEMQSINGKALLEEVDKLLEQLRIPSELAACLTIGSLDEARVFRIVEACEWLEGVMPTLEVPNIDPAFVNMRAVKDKRAELVNLKTTFVRRASEYLTIYFDSLVAIMEDKNYFSQKGQLKRPDHTDLRNKCKIYANILQHLKVLDQDCLGTARETYCNSLNPIFKKEAHEFADELRASTMAPRNPTGWLEGSVGSGQNANIADTSVADSYTLILTLFVPLLVDECTFFAHFMCFNIPPVAPSVGDEDQDDDNDDRKSELASLNKFLQVLLDGIQEDFISLVDWAYKADPLSCISMHGITKRFLTNQKAEAAAFVSLLLGELESHISSQFMQFVEDACDQIEKYERNVRQTGVLPYIPRFATLATRMEQYIQGQTRDLVDLAYMKFVTTMFMTLEKVSLTDQTHPDIFLLENYAAFQNSLYDLANVVPTLAKFYHQASENYEKACLHHINMVIYYQFERLFQFAKKIEDSMLNISSEEIPFQIGLSKADLRKALKSSISGIDRSFVAMHKKLQKNLNSEELLPSLWEKCKKEFLDKYGSFVQIVNKTYPQEKIPSVKDIRDILEGI